MEHQREAVPEALVLGEMPSRYDWTATEQELYTWWESMGYFKPEIAEEIPSQRAGGAESYVIPMPPPNVTGRLHMGHAMFASIEDALARFHRMYGDRTLWLPGMDHAGIATQMLVERQLTAEGTSRQTLGRDAFLERVWAWKKEKGGAITGQLRNMGASCDWSREQFTLNPEMNRAVNEAFIRLHEQGLIFRGQRMVNWSPVLQTAVSDLEVEYSEVNGSMFHFKYVVADADGQASDEYIPVATTRPETILGDSAVCVHPEDPRYQHLVGKRVMVPMQGRTVPVIADEYVDREFGTGALKVTPAHDFNDFELAKRHDLAFHSIVALDGSMSQEVSNLGSPQYAGLDRQECRSRLWADLEAAGLALVREDHLQRVPLSQRSGEVIEPMLSDQWFVRTEDIAQRALDAVEQGDIEVQPERYKKTWRTWLQEKQPWCVSRQLWWGHRIPVFYVEGSRPDAALPEYYVAQSMEDALEKARADYGAEVQLRQDPDVLDTWFSSGLWPFATLGWPNATADLEKYYPAAILETGYDILFFWVARMVMMGLALTDKVPFKTIYLHGLVRDESGQKMSKTKGNVVDPLDSIAEYGTDALRFALLTSTVPGMDTPIGKGIIESGKAFVNKIWNVGRYIITDYERNSAVYPKELITKQTFTQDELQAMPWIERALVSKCHGVVEEVTKALLENKLAPPTKVLREFLQEDLAAWYIEASKTRLQEQLGGDPASEAGRTSQRVLLYLLRTSLRLLHPFMPFVTEAVWQRLPGQGEGASRALIVAPWSILEGEPFRDREAEEWFSRMCLLTTAVRNSRVKQDIPPKERVGLTFRCRDAGLAGALQSELSAVCWLCRGDPAKAGVATLAEGQAPAPENVVRTIVTEDLEVDMPITEKEVDFAKEVARLSKQLAKIEGDLRGTEKKINPSFLEKAAPAAVEKVMKHKEELMQTRTSVSARLEEMKLRAAEAGR